MRRSTLRLSRETSLGPRVQTTAQVIALLQEVGLPSEAQEVVIVVAYDTMANARAVVEVARGGWNATMVHIPSILSAVLTAGCDRFIVAHNHPNGDCVPSSEDVALTQRIAWAADACDLFFEDHVIVGPDPHVWYSFTARKLLHPRPYRVAVAAQ